MFLNIWQHTKSLIFVKTGCKFNLPIASSSRVKNLKQLTINTFKQAKIFLQT